MTTSLAERTRRVPSLDRALASIPAQVASPACRPRLEPVPECEPPLDTEPWESFHSTAAMSQPPQALTLRPAPAYAGFAHAEPVCPEPPRLSFRHWPQLGAALPAARAGARSSGAVVTPNPVYAASGTVAYREEYADPAPAGLVESVTTAPARLPSAMNAATVLTRALIEVLAGRRPQAQVRSHCVNEVFNGLQRFPRLGPGPSLASLWVCETTPGRAEVSASFRCNGVTRPLAMQLRIADGAWVVTALQLA